MGSLTRKLEAEVASWPHVSVVPHQFMAKEFRYRKAEIGHVHFWGDVDIPFPPAVHDVLLAEGRAQRHRWLPHSGWVTFHMHNDADEEHAIWLLRLSHLRYELKSAADAERVLAEQTERLRLGPALAALMAQFVPRLLRGIKVGADAAQDLHSPASPGSRPGEDAKRP
ncbi:MAG TPA: luciferase family protein [Terracidiphilus sp.]|nr:luciferase family protein [Terracidiphilus sp.]